MERDAIAKARKEHRDVNKELFLNKIYPINDGQASSSFWEHEPNDEANREN